MSLFSNILLNLEGKKEMDILRSATLYKGLCRMVFICSSYLSLCNKASPKHSDLKQQLLFIRLMNAVCQGLGKYTVGTVVCSSCLGP